jgi:hypothetical protein
MPVALRYIGAEERFFEVAITGQQQGWFRGQTSTVSDVNAPLLLATGKFERAAPSTSSGTVGLEAFKAALRSAVSRRQRPNPAPLTAPAAFAAGPYTSGDIVSSGGNWYQCVNPADNGPTRTATLAPTGTTNAVICPDGASTTTCCWMFYSPAQTLDSLGYSITATPPQAALPAYASSNRSLSGWDTSGAQDDVIYRTATGIVLGKDYGKADRIVGVYKASNGTDIFQPANVIREYVTDSTFFVVRNPYGSNGMMLVNGKPLLPGYSVNCSGTNAYYGANFGSRERRVITLIGPGTPTNIYVDSKATFFQPSTPAPWSDFFGLEMGDSWTGGVQGMGIVGGQGLFEYFCAASGMQGYSFFSLGGTGVWNDNAVAGNDYLGRWRAGVARGWYDSKIKLLGIQGSVNDGVQASPISVGTLGLLTSAALTDRTLTLAREMRAACPNAVILFKAIPADDAVIANIVRTNAAYKAAYDAFAATDANCLWIDCSTTSPSATATINTRNTPAAASLPPTLSTESLIGGPSATGMNGSHPSMWGNILMAQDQVGAMYRALNLDLPTSPFRAV